MSLIRFVLLALSPWTSAVLVRPPTSIYAVDSFARELIDYNRQDPYAARDGQHHPRRLMASVFFPIGLPKECEFYAQNYMPPATAAVYDAMYDQYGLPKDVFGTLQLSSCSSHQSNSRTMFNATFPTALFSPGLGNSRLVYSGIAQSLASRGFIVVTIDHPYDACIVEFPDGSTILGANISTTKQITFDLQVRVADVTFVLDQLKSGAFPTPGLQHDDSKPPERFIMYGHSLGGATAIAAMSIDSRITGAVNLDGTMFGPVVSSGVSCPMVLFAHPNHTLATDQSWNSTWTHSANATRLELVLEDSAHGTFTDFPLLVDAIKLPKKVRSELAVLIGTIPGLQVNEILGKYLQSFFQFSLGNSQSPVPFCGPSRRVDILERIDHGACV